MARALWSFRAVGYPAIPAPSLEEGDVFSLSAGSFLPRVPELVYSYYALHELFALAGHMCRYGNWSVRLGERSEFHDGVCVK
jgi:hypothetical protein